MPDELLIGTSNGAAITYIQRVNPKARVIVTAGSTRVAQELYNAEADFMLEPWMETADRMINVLKEFTTQESSDSQDLTI